MTRTTCIAGTTLLLLAAGGCQNDDAQATRGDPLAASALNGGDVPVTLDECPPAVRATILARLEGGTITELERTTDHGEVLYEVDVRTTRGVVEFDVAEDGAFRGYEAAEDDDDGPDADDDEDDDGEEEIPLSEVPDHAKAAAVAAVPGLVLEEAERETEDGVVVYSLEGEADGKEYEVEVNADGDVLEIELDDEDDEDDD